MALMGGILTGILIFLVTYWVWRPKGEGGLSFFQRVQKNWAGEREALETGFRCGLTANVIITGDIYLFTGLRFALQGEKRFLRALIGGVLGFLLVYFAVGNLTGGLDARMFRRFGPGGTEIWTREQATQVNCLLAGFIAGSMAGGHIYLFFKPEGEEG
jgi:small-conductance mechanosensitive channel